MAVTRLSIVIALLLGAFALPAWAQSPLPNPRLTPGAINPAVTQGTIDSTICVRGWTRKVRPPEHYTERLKRRQIAAYGYHRRRLRNYEEDHLIPLELGGAPADPRNLWPEPHLAAGQWGSYAKDRLENRLNELVCDGTVPLDAARKAIATDWSAAYRHYVGPSPDNRPLRYYREEGHRHHRSRHWW